MVLIKLLFAALIIVCAVFYVLYIWDFSLVLLVVIIAVPILMFVSLLITKYLISVEFAVKSTAATKNEVFDIQLCVSNRSVFPVGKAEAIIEYYNVFNNQINTIELHFPIQSRNSQRVTFQLSSKFCGIIKIRSAYISIYDPLRIFRFKVGKNISQNITVLPEGHEIGGVISSTDRLNDESLAFSEHKPGDDPSEVFDLREYSEGDKLNRIHWKLSSKKDDFIVKEYSYPVDSPTAVFLDLRCLEFSEYTLPLYDTLIESMVSASQFLLENERMHTIIYYNAKEKRFAQRTVSNIDSLASVVSELLNSISDDLSCDNPDSFFADLYSSGWSCLTLITSQNDEKLFSYIDEAADADIKNIIAVIKDSSHAEEFTKPYSSLNVIPVVIGKISSSIRDIEM